MKRFLLVLAALVAFGLSAGAQRQSVMYGSLGVAHRWGLTTSSNAGPNVALGFRNYNRDAIVSFTYGAELLGYWIPENAGNLFGVYAIPQLGVAIGPSGFKVYPHTGFMMGYGSDYNTFGTGIKSGLAFDFGSHITLDFSSYYTFNNAWTSALNFIWRF